MSGVANVPQVVGFAAALALAVLLLAAVAAAARAFRDAGVRVASATRRAARPAREWRAGEIHATLHTIGDEAGATDWRWPASRNTPQTKEGQP